MNYGFKISKVKRIYEGEHNANKYWSWDSTSSSESSRKNITVNSGEEKLKELLELAASNGYELADFRLEFTKVLDKHTRKDVVFDLSRKF